MDFSYLSNENEQITKEKACLYVNQKYFYDGDILDIIMIANILCSTIDMELYSQTDIKELKAHIRISGLEKIRPGAYIEVIASGHDQLFTGDKV